jgi:hypothetical protein
MFPAQTISLATEEKLAVKGFCPTVNSFLSKTLELLKMRIKKPL